MQATRTKTIFSIIAVILTVAVLYIFFFVKQWQQSQQLILQTKKEQVTSLVEIMTSELDNQYRARIKSFALQQKDIVRFFAERDRDELYRATEHVYKTLKRENQYFDHINFILPENEIFLRMHAPDQYGDEVQYSCRVYTDTEGEPSGGSSGFVYGRCGLLYRVIEPLYYQGNYVGNVLFGIHLQSFISELSSQLDMHTALAVRSDKAGVAMVKEENVSVSGDYLIQDYGDPFFQEQSGQISLTGEEQQYRHQEAIHYVFPSYIIKDNDGKEIGRILQGIDLTDVAHSHRNDIIRLVLITLAVIVVASYILYYSFTKIIGEMGRLNEELEKKNKELLQAGQELEQQVLKRTSELGDANSQLIKEIEERHEANLSLIQSIEEWQSTFDAIGDPVTILDKDLEVVIANSAAQEMLRQDDKEIVGRTCYELFAGSAEPCELCPAADVFATGVKKEYEVEHQYLGKNLLVSCSPIYDNNEITGYVHTARDITEEKILKKQLSQAQKMEAIATLAGGIAHDFNNILGAILGNADLLLYRLIPPAGMDKQKMQEISPEEIASHIEAIKKAGNRAKELVSQILAFSRQSKTRRQDVIITPVIKEGVKLLKSSLTANIKVMASIDQDACHINADLGQIHQVFMNLCTNAAQAMSDKGGILEISLQNFQADAKTRKIYPDVLPGQYLMLRVKDTGHGMSREVMERIFDPFFTTRDVGEGTGMGLSVIHGIITSHHGILDVKSEVDEGSEFTVFFPCIGESKQAAEDPVLGVPRGTERILFVDDEQDIVKMSTSMLEYLGYTVLSATSGEEALEKLKSGEAAKTDLIICDYSMPGMSGTDLAAEVLESEKRVPFILCSGFSESVVLDDQSKKIIRKFMSKPLDMKKLAIAIREVLS